MLFITSRIVHAAFNTQQGNLNRFLIESSSALQVRFYAARKGTRERKQKKKVKQVVEKVGFIPHNQRDKEKFLQNRVERKFDDSYKQDPIDDVFAMKYHKWIVYPFEKAVEAHRETHHPEIYNKPNADLHVSIELNMQGEKKTRFVDNFTRVVAVPHKFDHGQQRMVIAFAKDQAALKKASEAGAELSGGVELIKQIQNGQVDLNNFQYIISHPDILPELVSLRGIMKKSFPNVRTGTLDTELGTLVTKFLHGISYTATKDEYEKDFGIIETVIGTLNMDVKHLEKNFEALVKDVYTMKPKREGHFISRCLLWSPPSREKLKVGHEQYLDLTNVNKAVVNEEEEEEIVEKIAL